MKTLCALLSLWCAMCAILSAPRPGALAQGLSNAPTRTIVGDLLMIDRDLYIVRGDSGEIQIEATPDTKIAEDFQFGDRIKASVLMNNQALTITRAGPDDVPGVVEDHSAPVAPAPDDAGTDDAGAAVAAVEATMSGPPKRPTGKTIVGDLLMIDRDLYIVRGDRGEMQIEATPDTKIAEAFHFGDRIKASVLMNNKALTITRAGPDDVPGVMVHGAFALPRSASDDADAADGPVTETPTPTRAPIVPDAGLDDGTRVVEGQLLMVDGDFYVIRGERGEIRVERTPDTRMIDTVQFGDFLKATVTSTDRALSIERLR